MPTVQIEITEQEADVLSAKATTFGVSAEQYLRQVIEQDLGTAKPRRHISEIIADIMKDVPREIFEALPRDGASEHDHYLYGSPKRNL